MSNHLANQSSPYLLQHASNPVDWYPWGEEAFEKRGKRISRFFEYRLQYLSLVSIVMAHESFESEENCRDTEPAFCFCQGRPGGKAGC